MQEITNCYPPQTQKRKWKKTIRILSGWFYITFSNCQVKKRSSYNRSGNLAQYMREIKEKLYKKHEGICPQCGEYHDIKDMEIHHVLPWSRFPELQGNKHNMLLLCHHCHKEIHCNPWLNIQMMQAKAAELGINLNDRYKI